jgi:hypothetical protein
MFDKYQILKAKGKTPVMSLDVVAATETSPAQETAKMTYPGYDPDTGALTVNYEETMNVEELKQHIKAIKARLAAAREVYNLATGKVPE